MNYKIITDATSDLPSSVFGEMNVHVIPMDYTLEGTPYSFSPEINQQSIQDFYNEMRNGKTAVTSQINSFKFTEHFEPYLKEGTDIIYLGFSSGLSSTIGSANVAANELMAKYPGRRIVCIDTLAASLGEGLMVYYAARLQKTLNFDAMVKWVESNKLNFVHWFTVDDLTYLKRGGRVSGATAAIGTVLQIKPVMHVDNEGHLVAVEKVQGRKKSLKQMVDNMEATVNREMADKVWIGNCDSYDDAKHVAELVKARFNYSDEDIVIDNIGPVIGAHSGPGTIALFYYGSKR